MLFAGPKIGLPKGRFLMFVCLSGNRKRCFNCNLAPVCHLQLPWDQWQMGSRWFSDIEPPHWTGYSIPVIREVKCKDDWQYVSWRNPYNRKQYFSGNWSRTHVPWSLPHSCHLVQVHFGMTLPAAMINDVGSFGPSLVIWTDAFPLLFSVFSFAF